MIKNIIQNNIFHIVFIALLTCLVYVNTLENSFLWDDYDFILNWPLIRSLENVPSLLSGSVPRRHPGVYRPIRGLFYALNYQIWGQNPVGYHFNALLIHLSATILIYFIAASILKNNTTAFMGSLLFGLHPIHTEAISYITASFDQIGIVFFLGAFYFYIRSQMHKEYKMIMYFVSIFLAVLAFLSYEFTLTLPIIIILYDFCFQRMGKKNIMNKLKVYSPYFLIVLIYVFARCFILKTITRGHYLAGNFYLTMLAMTKAIIKYISLLIFPLNLNVNHTVSKGIFSLYYTDLNKEAVLSQSIFDMNIVGSIILILLLLASAIILRKKLPIFSFCIGLFFISLLPVTNLIPISTLVTEDSLYLPSFGFCLLLAFFVYTVYNLKLKDIYRRIVKISMVIIFIAIALFYSARTILRNKDWRDEITLWSKTFRQSPESSLVNNNLGIAYYRIGEYEKAVPYYQNAIRFNPQGIKAYNNLGATYYYLGQFNKAISYCKEAIRLRPHYPGANFNLALIYQSLGQYQETIYYYKRFLLREPDDLEVNFNLGFIYQYLGQFQEAIPYYKKALQVNHKIAQIHHNLGIVYNNLAQYEEAISSYQKAIELKPDLVEAYNNLGAIYGNLAQYEEAAVYFLKAAELKPDDAKTHRNLGLIYNSLGQHQEAERFLNKSIKLFKQQGKKVDALKTKELLIKE